MINSRTFSAPFFTVLIFALTLQAQTGSDQNISGASRLFLTAPLTQEQKTTQKKNGFDTLVINCIQWISDSYHPDFEYDKNNRSIHFLMSDVLIRNRSRIQEKVDIKNHFYIVDYSISTKSLLELLPLYEKEIEQKVATLWNSFSSPMISGQEKLNAGLQCLLYSRGRLGRTGTGIGDGGAEVVGHERIRASVQDFLKTVSMDFTTPIVAGKPSKNPVKPVTVTIRFDTIPARNFPLVAELWDGTRLFETHTDIYGSASFAKLKVPFVPLGEMLFIKYDLGSLFDTDVPLDIGSLGLLSQDEINQNIVFKPEKQTFTLDYKVTAANPQIEIPPDFQKPEFISKFFQDSCSLTLADKSRKPDFEISIFCQISNYTIDELELSQVKMDAFVKITEPTQGGNRREESQMLLERHFKFNEPIPYGLFFWECSSRLKKFTRSTLNKL